MRIEQLDEETEKPLRHVCFKDKLFATLHEPLKQLRPDYTAHSPTELWMAAIGFTEEIVDCEEEEEVDEEIDSCLSSGRRNDGFLLLFISMYQLAALRKSIPVASRIIPRIKRRIKGHELYDALFHAVSSKENRRIGEGKGVDIDHYHLEAHAEERTDSVGGRETVDELVGIAIAHADPSLCDHTELLLRRYNERHGHAFDEEIDRLALASDKANREAREPRVNARNYHRYESGSQHDDHSRQLYLAPPEASSDYNEQHKLLQQ